MAEVLIFGSLSGTEPMENMHHTSLAVRVKTTFTFSMRAKALTYS